MKVPKEESKDQNNDNTVNEDDSLSNPYDSESNDSDSIDPPTRDGDFSEYMWMENQEEFDLQVLFLNFCFIEVKNIFLFW